MIETAFVATTYCCLNAVLHVSIERVLAPVSTGFDRTSNNYLPTQTTYFNTISKMTENLPVLESIKYLL